MHIEINRGHYFNIPPATSTGEKTGQYTIKQRGRKTVQYYITYILELDPTAGFRDQNSATLVTDMCGLRGEIKFTTRGTKLSAASASMPIPALM
jgi:hypothetical protein